MNVDRNKINGCFNERYSDLPTRDHCEVMIMFCVLIGVYVTQMYISIKTFYSYISDQYFLL